MNTSVRPAAVAGMFYPESRAVLGRDVMQMLARARQKQVLRPKAIIVPHAGYIYSGPVAASIYAPLSALRDTIKRIVLLGPTHRVAVNGLALPASKAFATPLGIVPVDQQAVAAIADLPQIIVSEAAHALEHSLEVQLPFLQTVFGDFSLLPLAVGQASPQAVAEVLERVWGGEETLIVISSDLSHYLPYAAAREIDAPVSYTHLTLPTTYC
jgi:AmmeMemoRadiSam system protein B